MTARSSALWAPRSSARRAPASGEDGRTAAWRSKALPRYQRPTKRAEALIAAVYLAGTSTRRVKRALFGLFQGVVGKDVVSRAWRKVKADGDARAARSLAEEDIVRRSPSPSNPWRSMAQPRRHGDPYAAGWKATSICAPAAIGVRSDGQKILLSIRRMGGESTAAGRQFLDDLDARGPKRPAFVIVDGAPGLAAALNALRGADPPIQRCTARKHRNLLGHAPKAMRDEVTEDYRDMIYAETAAEVESRRKALLRKWRLKGRAVADSLEEAGERLFAFTRLDPSRWKSARTANAIERLNEEFRRRIKTQTALPRAETAPMPLWAPLASGQSAMRKVDGGETLSQHISQQPLTKPPDQAEIAMLGECRSRISTTSQTRPSRHHATSINVSPVRLPYLKDASEICAEISGGSDDNNWPNALEMEQRRASKSG